MNTDYFNDDIDVTLEEVELIDTPEADDENEAVQIIIGGVKIAEEVKKIVSMCSNEEEEVDTLFPLYIVMDGCKERVGLFDLTLSNIIKLIFINRGYVITLVNNSTSKTITLYSENEDVVESLEKLVRLI